MSDFAPRIRYVLQKKIIILKLLMATIEVMLSNATMSNFAVVIVNAGLVLFSCPSFPKKLTQITRIFIDLICCTHHLFNSGPEI